jgi:hypothetical protein
VGQRQERARHVFARGADIVVPPRRGSVPLPDRGDREGCASGRAPGGGDVERGRPLRALTWHGFQETFVEPGKTTGDEEMPAMDAKLKLVAKTVSLLALASCSDPFKFDGTKVEPPEEEICPASDEWLPDAPALDMFKPLPHPSGECPFYRGGWQNFLIATKPDANGVPAIRYYPTIDDIFKPAKPHGANRSWLGDIKQAGGRQILIDQNGHTLYYGIHVNQAFVDFVKANKLETAQGIRDASDRLFFPAGVVEFKSAWQEVVDPKDPTLDTYITVRAPVPRLKQVDGKIIEDRNRPREVQLRLLALHVVYTLPGHPEFIWSTFEHSTASPGVTDTQASDGQRNVAPTGGVNPLDDDPLNQHDTTVVCKDEHLLCKAGTKANEGNRPIDESTLKLDEATQTFPGQQTSIYRMFPASKSNTIDPDAAIKSLNHNTEALFMKALADGRIKDNDKRWHYRLVGAQWMDKPAYFQLDSPLQNDETNPFVEKIGRDALLKAIREDGSDSDFSILAGEDRLSSTAMESFTQAPDSFTNCFSCHNTQAVTAKGVPFKRDEGGVKLLDPKLINVSHVLTQFLLEESEAQ